MTEAPNLFDPWRDPIEPTPEQMQAYRDRLVGYRAMKPWTRAAEAHELLSGQHYSWLLWMIDQSRKEHA